MNGLLAQDADVLDLLTQMAPVWVRWSNVIVALSLFPLGWLIGFSFGRGSQRRLSGLSNEAHWSERARLVYPVRVGLVKTILFVVLFGGLLVVSSSGVFSTVHPLVLLIPGAILGGVGASRGARPIISRYDPARNMSRRERWRSIVARNLLFFSVFWLGLIGAFLVDSSQVVSTRNSLVLSGVGLAYLALLGPGSIWLGTRVGVVRPADAELVERLHRELDDQIGEAGPPRVFIIAWWPANAIALPFANTIAFTENGLQLLSFDQLVAVARHEIAHLNEPASAKAARITGGFGLCVFFLSMPVWGSRGLLGLLVGVVLMIFSVALLQRVGRRMEVRADEHATGRDSDSDYAAALETIYEFNLIPAVMKGGTHPSLYDRMQSAGVEPDFPRPEPPARHRPGYRGFVLIGLLLFLTIFSVRISVRDSGMAWLSLATPFGGAQDMERLGELEQQDGNYERAHTFYSGAIWLSWNRLGVLRLKRASMLVEMGHCALAFDEVQDALEYADIELFAADGFFSQYRHRCPEF